MKLLKIRSAVFIVVLTILTGCLFAMSAQPAKPVLEKVEALTVFITGNELGSMRPCGCSGGQLGGFDRRAAILKQANPSTRLIIDTGRLIKKSSEQDIIKLNIMMQAYIMLGYDMLNLTREDIEIAKTAGLFESIKSNFNVISNAPESELPAIFTKELKISGEDVYVNIVSFDTKSGSVEDIPQLFDQQKDAAVSVNILIVSECDEQIIGSLKETGVIDCLICPSEADEPGIVSFDKKGPLVITVGELGKYVAKLQIDFGEDMKKELKFTSLPVTEDLPQDESIVDLFKTYNQLVKDAGLLEAYPKYPLSDGLEYTGSASCKVCHEYEYNKWSEKAHAHAYATLVKAGSQYDPECVICHVVGMEYETGYVSEEKTPNLKDVGCENCHGPGSQHNKTYGMAKTTQPMSDCTDCHTPENSVNFAGNELKYFEKIVHWREPNEPEKVDK